MRKSSDYYTSIPVRKDTTVKADLKKYCAKEGLTFTEAINKLLNEK